jgi:hypothetical protein
MSYMDEESKINEKALLPKVSSTWQNTLCSKTPYIIQAVNQFAHLLIITCRTEYMRGDNLIYFAGGKLSRSMNDLP